MGVLSFAIHHMTGRAFAKVLKQKTLGHGNVVNAHTALSGQRCSGFRGGGRPTSSRSGRPHRGAKAQTLRAVAAGHVDVLRDAVRPGKLDRRQRARFSRLANERRDGRDGGSFVFERSWRPGESHVEMEAKHSMEGKKNEWKHLQADLVRHRRSLRKPRRNSGIRSSPGCVVSRTIGPCRSGPSR